ncbi:MAG: iron complex transport system substrate-binding [Planctomycetota bacterium]|nr:MAG: iron complex transport system substrate-binding [Planctomycetota bacterium]
MSLRALVAVLLAAAIAAAVVWPRGRARREPAIPAKRVVSLVPSATDILYDIGAGDRVVAVTRFCRWPPEAASKEIVGGFADLNIERIVALRPDAVVEVSSFPKALDQLHGAGLPVQEIRVLRLADALDQYGTLGRLVGRESEAAAARRRLEEGMGREAARWKNAPRVRVALVTERLAANPQDVYIAGETSFISELAARVGGDNVFNDLGKDFAKVSPEDFVTRAPDVILELNSVDPPSDANALAAWSKLPAIPAVKSKRVRVLSQDFLLAPGSRMDQSLRVLGEALR